MEQGRQARTTIASEIVKEQRSDARMTAVFFPASPTHPVAPLQLVSDAAKYVSDAVSFSTDSSGRPQYGMAFGKFLPTPNKPTKNRETRSLYCEQLRSNFGTFPLDAYSSRSRAETGNFRPRPAAPGRTHST
jgi:hypothetical protein